jgi:hypothetical protein
MHLNNRTYQVCFQSLPTLLPSYGITNLSVLAPVQKHSDLFDALQNGVS